MVAFGVLLVAILSEVAATAALPRAEGFRDPGWTVFVLGGYAVSIWLLAVVVKSDLMASGPNSGCSCSNPAAAPATIGEEKLVPLLLVYPEASYIVPDVRVFSVAEYTFSPTATRSGLIRKSVPGPTELKEEMIFGVVGTAWSLLALSIETCAMPEFALMYCLSALLTSSIG